MAALRGFPATPMACEPNILRRRVREVGGEIRAAIHGFLGLVLISDMPSCSIKAYLHVLSRLHHIIS